MAGKHFRRQSYSESRILEIKEAVSLSLRGVSTEEIAKRLGITERQVYNLKKTDIWKEESERLKAVAQEARTEAHKERMASYLALMEKAAAGNIKSALTLQATVNQLLQDAQKKLVFKDEYTLEDLKIIAGMPRVISGAILDAYSCLREASGIDDVLELLDKTDG